MDKKEYLKSMITNLVHEREDEAAEDFHSYLQVKMREVASPQNQSSIDDDEDL